MTISEKLKELRKNKGISQTVAGRLISPDKTTDGSAQAKMKRIESGDQELTVSEAITLAKYYKIDVNCLIKDETLPLPSKEDKVSPAATSQASIWELKAFEQMEKRIAGIEET
jgi:transcriptional regulator with XRE-family HTH domain